MKIKKKRSDIAKIVSRCREVWRQSENYQTAKRKARDPDRSGWFLCPVCKASREVIAIDHVEPIGKQPNQLTEFGEWLDRLFNLPQVGICRDCHREKTKTDKKRIKDLHKHKKL